MAFEQTFDAAADNSGDWITMNDGARLYLRRWKTGAAPKAVVHIVHGMAEHSGRYDRLARRLGREGIEVWAADQRGHGKTANTDINEPDRGGVLGHCADWDGFARVCSDVDAINRAVMKEYPEVPVFLFGHSWGSFISQSYIENFEGRPGRNGENPVTLAGCILSGTKGPGDAKVKMGALVIGLLSATIGERNGSKIVKALADGPYNKAFKPNRTGFDWLSRDEKEVDAYIADPCCGFLCSTGFYRDTARALKRIHLPVEMDGIRKELPVYIISGSADPVGNMGVSPAALAVAYRHKEIKDLETVLYPDARHELLNETNREEVQESLVSWLLQRCKTE